MQMKEKWLNLGPAKQFILKSVLCVAIWRLVYVFILEPIRFPDKILTLFIGRGTIIFVNFFSKSGLSKAYCIENRYRPEVMLVRDNRSILRIGDACNGLELMLIYAGVIALLPGKISTKAVHIGIGFIALLLTNMLRCAGLEWVYEFYRPLFETTHHYLFTLVMYVIIFYGWVLYINKLKKDA